MKKAGQVLLASLILFAGACKKKETSTPEITNVTINTSLPSVTTLSLLAAEDLTATISSAVSSEGTSAITAVGVCWDTLTGPTTLRPHTNDGAGTGTYQSLLYNLKANTTYYVRSYATNATGTSYGNELSFKTSAAWEMLPLFSNPGFNAIVYANSTLFVGTSSSGIIKSTDEGDTWTQAGLPNTTVNSFAVSGTDIYAGTYNNGVYKSTNGGLSWTSINTGLNDTYIRYVAAKESVVFATNSYGLNISVNGGSNWSNVSSNLPSSYITSLVYNGTDVFIGTNSYGVYRSSNNGSSWTAVNTGLGINTNVYSLCISGTYLLASFANGDLYRSADNGSSWSKINSVSGNTVFSFTTKDNEVYAGGYGVVYISKDNGMTFKESRAGLSNQMLYGIATSDQNIFAAGSYLYRRALQ